MKFKPKGRKIYSSKNRHGSMFNRPSKKKRIFSAIMMLLVIAVLVVVGYSVANPILDYFNGKKDKDTAASNADAVLESTVQTEQTNPAETTTTAPETTLSTTTTTVTTTKAKIAVDGHNYIGAYLTETDLESADALDVALDAFESGTTVIVPLKISGGSLLYASDLESARACGASGTALTLSEITALIASHELTAIAKISTLSDNLYPDYNYEAGYFVEEDHTRWLDDKVSEGGKPWLSPFSDEAKSYLQEITTEICQSGFSLILCDDLIFPDFYSTDLDYIGESVQDDSQRSMALVSVLNAINSAANTAGGSAMYGFSLYDALNREEEVLDHPLLLEIPNMVVMIDMNSFSETFWYGNDKYSMSGLSLTERLEVLMPIAEQLTGQAAVVPCLRKKSLSDEELSEVITALQAMGYTRYILK